LLYYIGSSKDIFKRAKGHNKKECKYNNQTLKRVLGKIYATEDNLTKFKKLYPLYKLSKGEWLALPFYLALRFFKKSA
jgi:predicted GIY-YIG superfamily endonuclease